MNNQRDSFPATAKVFYGLGSVLLVLGLLYFGKPVLVPVALSVLLAFILSPLVTTLEKWKLGRLGAVLVASGLAFGVIGIASWALISQVQLLAEDLPNHKEEIKAKIDSFKVDEDSTSSKLSHMFEELFLIGDASASSERGGDGGERTANPEQRGPIVVASKSETPLASATKLLVPILEPVATAALVIVLVIFLLLRREDVRYRMISLMGDSALTGTTRLMRDTAERVSKYLLYLLLVNAGFGLWFAVGLYFLGVPYAPLWGFLTLCFRFIPFLGSPASVLFPMLVSIATSIGWTQPILLLVFFTISELITANIIEPVLFGKTTGLTPIALLIAALFWAWIWGPVGLLLSTPLTVCLVVLGQHLPHLRSLKVLLAEQPVLDARLQFFQRLLAQDQAGGHDVYEQYLDDFGQERAFDEVLVPALCWTRVERAKEVISAAEERFIWNATRDSFDKADEAKLATAASKTETTTPKCRLFGHPVHHESEEIALAMLQRLVGDDFEMKVSTTKQLPSKVIAHLKEFRPDVVVLTVLPPGGLPQVRYMCEEVRAIGKAVPIIVAYLGKVKDYDDLLVKVREAGASYLTTSLAQTTHQIEKLVRSKSAATGMEVSDLFPESQGAEHVA